MPTLTLALLVLVPALIGVALFAAAVGIARKKGDEASTGLTRLGGCLGIAGFVLVMGSVWCAGMIITQ